jgi:phosphoglycolate phosphatase
MENHHGLVIFDLDGTLYCSHTATVMAVQEVFERFGVRPPAEQQIIDYIGPSEDEFRAWLRTLCPPQIAYAVVDAVFLREHDLLPERAQLYPGTYEVLISLRATVGQMAICTHATPDYADYVVNSHQIASFFDLIRYRRRVEDTKFEMMRDVLSRLHCRPGVMVGDRDVDIEAAHAHGLQAIGVSYGYGSPEELAGADAIAADASQVTELVHRLLGHDRGV